MQIQTKITLIFTALCISFLILQSFGIYYFTYKHASKDFSTRLKLRAEVMAKAYADDRAVNGNAYQELKDQHLEKLTDETEYIINIDTLNRLDNTPFYETMDRQFIQSILKKGSAYHRDKFDFYYGFTYPYRNSSYVAIAKARNTDVEEFVKDLRNILIITSIVGLALIFTTGFLFSRQILGPLRIMQKHLTQIGGTSLHQRLNIKNRKDEIAELGNSFNELLSRLETAFESQNNFVSNASHELNTPLTTIIGETEYALIKERSIQQYQQSLYNILTQAEKLKAITHGLVELARSGFTGNFSMLSVNMHEVIHNAITNAHDVYQDCDIRVDLSLLPKKDQPLMVKGNEQLLELAISNVLMNACKYSDCKPVLLALALSEKHIITVITDQGIGIPEEEIKNIFNPFFRASNTKGIIGYGIGLPLSQNILRLHKGNIQFHSEVGVGTEVTIRLPLE
ncbi:HAMP domain-containing sensor histidine kinase [Niabella beijingensis]|uniref:HAMP domain-containing sensor histidine kinase n=1 Tax=Niabella beijingensis TaxID=2872700 RepID=UPI001CBD0E66|nr:HAMP domain-containing sensor histidine kinase [Niabella beijingensis]MBZ4188424.1 HAMP domain-containing histidine kinase [Niabella beijingensis]